MTFDFGGVSVAVGVGSVAAAQEVVVFAAAVHLRHHALLDVVEAGDSGLGLEGVGAMFRPCLFLFFVLLLNEITYVHVHIHDHDVVGCCWGGRSFVVRCRWWVSSCKFTGLPASTLSNPPM